MFFLVVPIYCSSAGISGQPQISGTRLLSDGTELVDVLQECTKCTPTGNRFSLEPNCLKCT